MGNDKSIDITSILESSMTELKKNNKEVYDFIIKKSKEGFFENHQTPGNFKSLAKEILDISLKQE